PRIGERKIGLHRGLAVPGRDHAHVVGKVLDRDLGAQLVKAELVGKVLGQWPRAIDQEAAAMAGWCLRDQEVEDDLALRGQQCAEPSVSWRQLRHICRDKAVEKVTRILAGYLDHAPIGKKRCLHVAKFLFKFLLKAS